MTGSQTAKPRVLIVGAGLGGLTLAQCLRKQGIPFEIFERDTSADSRFLGWAIGIHSNWLSTNIPIQWGKRPTKVEQIKDEIRLHFEDGTTATGDILVGADGTNSFVREHLLNVPNTKTLRTTPSCMIVGETTVTGEAFERQLSIAHSAYVAASAAPGDYFVFVGLNRVSADGKSGRYYWFVMEKDPSIVNDDHWSKSASQAELYSHAVDLISTLEPRFSEIIRSTSADETRPQPWRIYDAEIENLPVGRITLLGDAGHPMGPFRGEGGVHALRDALNLSKAIAQIKSNDTDEIKSLLGLYQEEMLERGLQAVRASRRQHTFENMKGGIMAWGQKAIEVPDETITLEAVLP
ncbi:hypothetical protein Daesc_005529 [Daldinia eschscholtzii]|uniref:FAD-binding domain-containing protein n=1 Tax=Daldinia eschscholtzii TaxID=292717 RepID=A0AAX6MKS6_9PEZI